MRPATSRVAAALVFLGSACAGGRAPEPAAIPVAAGPADDRVAEVITTALEADTRLEPADSLYAEGSIVVAGGEVRYAPPRYAGVAPGGTVALTSSRVEVRAGMAWAQIEYRWMSTVEGIVREARATFVLVPDQGGAWRIRHAHSSAP